MTPEYLRSVEARLKLQDELLRQVFIALYSDASDEFEGFVKKMEDGLRSKPAPQNAPEEAMELRVEIIMQLAQFAKAVRQQMADVPLPDRST